MFARLTRLLTALMVIGLSAFAVLRGSQIIMFLGTTWVVAAEPNEAVSRLGRWFSVPGIAFAARNAAVRNELDLNHLREQFTEMVIESPFSSGTWGALAGLGLISREPRERAVEALMMSAITAPNELHLMPMRGKIGISLWEALPPERRIGVATDLVTAAQENMFDLDRAELLAILSAKSEEIRNDIRQYLLRVDGSSPRIMTYLGLPDPNAASRAK